MRLELSYTFEDLKEAMAAEAAALNPAGKDPTRTGLTSARSAIAAWVLFAGLAVLLFWVQSLNSSAPPSGAGPDPAASASAAAAARAGDRIDLFLTLIPAVVPSLMLIALAAFIVAASGQRRRVPYYTPADGAGSPLNRMARLAAGVIIVLVAGLFALLVWAPQGYLWAPTRFTLKLVAGGPVVLTIGVMMIAARQLQRRQVQYTWKNAPVLQRTTRVEIDPSGMRSWDSVVETRAAWSHFISFLETQTLFLLYTRDLTWVMFPKRAFADLAEQDQFRGLIQNNVPNGRFLARSSGFPVLPVAAAPAPTRSAA